MQVIPAIDVLDSKSVRLLKGRYEEVTVYHDHPAELARSWADSCARLHVVDLEGARAGCPSQRHLFRQFLGSWRAGVQLCGGRRPFAAVEVYISLGVDPVVLGTVARTVHHRVERAAMSFPDRFILAVDARRGMVGTGGWQ